MVMSWRIMRRTLAGTKLDRMPSRVLVRVSIPLVKVRLFAPNFDFFLTSFQNAAGVIAPIYLW